MAIENLQKKKKKERNLAWYFITCTAYNHPICNQGWITNRSSSLSKSTWYPQAEPMAGGASAMPAGVGDLCHRCFQSSGRLPKTWNKGSEESGVTSRTMGLSRHFRKLLSEQREARTCRLLFTQRRWPQSTVQGLDRVWSSREARAEPWAGKVTSHAARETAGWEWGSGHRTCVTH